MIKQKLYGNPKKSLMYRASVNKKGLIDQLEFRGPDRKKIFDGAVNTKKNPLKFSEIKKEKVLEYITFLLYYPAMIERDMRKIKTKDLPFFLNALEIKNSAIVNGVLKLRRDREKKQRSKKLSRKR